MNQQYGKDNKLFEVFCSSMELFHYLLLLNQSVRVTRQTQQIGLSLEGFLINKDCEIYMFWFSVIVNFESKGKPKNFDNKHIVLSIKICWSLLFLTHQKAWKCSLNNLGYQSCPKITIWLFFSLYCKSILIKAKNYWLTYTVSNKRQVRKVNIYMVVLS